MKIQNPLTIFKYQDYLPRKELEELDKKYIQNIKMKTILFFKWRL